MGLTAGTKLGPYKIRSPAGGRAKWEKCIARETLLEREAAIKILPANVSLRCESAPALEREAEAFPGRRILTSAPYTSAPWTEWIFW